jgi:hypothetical protein
MISIKVLGLGCVNGFKVAELARQSAEGLKVEASMGKVAKFPEIMPYHMLA